MLIVPMKYVFQIHFSQDDLITDVRQTAAEVAIEVKLSENTRPTTILKTSI